MNIVLFLFRWKTQLQELTKLPPFAKVSAGLNSSFPRYFKRKGDRETLAPERGYGKYTSKMADDE